MSRIAPLLLLLFALPTAAQTRYAVVVGANEYPGSKLGTLNYAEADAKDLAKALENAGFKVVRLVGKQVTKKAIEEAFEGLLNGADGKGKLTNKDTLLFAFAGHGQQFIPKGEADDAPFLCPPECNPLDAKTQVPLNALLAKAGDPKRNPGTALFLIDACRTSPSRGGGKDEPGEGVTGNNVKLKAQTVVLFAAANGQKAREHDDAGGKGNGHGLLMAEVIDALNGTAKNEDGEVTWAALVARVTNRVTKQSKALYPKLDDTQHQTPHFLGSLAGDVVLARVGTQPVPENGGWPGEKDYRKAEQLAANVKGLPFREVYAVRTIASEGTIIDGFELERIKTIHKLDVTELLRESKELGEQAGWFKTYQKAADAGHPLARIELAYQYRYGHVNKDLKKAEELEKLALPDILKAAKANNGEAQYILARMYAEGIGVKADSTEMLNWYTKAADQKHEAAYYRLAGCYFIGDEGGAWKANAETSLKWYRKAADEGFTGGMISLGSLYEKGFDLDGVRVEMNEAEAVNWYTKAAELGNATGQFSLGSMIESGRGVAKDKKAAVDWYRKAAKQGHEEAKAALERLGK